MKEVRKSFLDDFKIDLQLFADDGGDGDEGAGGGEEGSGEGEETKTEEDIRSEIESELQQKMQSEISKSVKEALKDQEKKFQKELERLEMSEEEKQKAEREEKEKELAQKEKEVAEKETRLNIIDVLEEQEISSKFKEFINPSEFAHLDEDERIDSITKRVKSLKTIFDKAVEVKVEEFKQEYLKGETPDGLDKRKEEGSGSNSWLSTIHENQAKRN